MLGTIIGIIFALIILGVLWWAVQQLMALIPIAEPFRTIIYVLSVILLVCVVLWIIATVLGLAGIHVNTMRLGAVPFTGLPLLLA